MHHRNDDRHHLFILSFLFFSLWLSFLFFSINPSKGPGVLLNFFFFSFLSPQRQSRTNSDRAVLSVCVSANELMLFFIHLKCCLVLVDSRKFSKQNFRVFHDANRSSSANNKYNSYARTTSKTLLFKWKFSQTWSASTYLCCMSCTSNGYLLLLFYLPFILNFYIIRI
jgi:hypothetical protein